jgi:hypothetical protein
MIIEISQSTPDLHLSTLLHKRTGNSAHLDEKAPWNRLIVLLNLVACGWFLAVILAPKYESSQYVVLTHGMVQVPLPRQNPPTANSVRIDGNCMAIQS